MSIFVGRDLAVLNKYDYATKLEKIEDNLRIWKTRDLSFVGQIRIVKSQALSNLAYSMSNIEMENSYLKQAQKQVFAFVWGS